MSNVIAPRALGSSTLEISGVGIGCNNFSRPTSPTVEQEASTRVILAALDAGITFFDTAELYGSEPGMSEVFMGVALRGRRDEAVIATKWGHTGGAPGGLAEKGARGSREHIRAAIEGSLRRLQTDHVDLYQLHEPDPSVPIEETLGALAELVQEGKVLEIGHTNFTAEQLREADAASGKADSGVRFVSAQNEYSLLKRDVESEILPFCAENGIGFLPYFPLYNGLLTGKYRKDGGEGRITRQKPQLLEGVDWDQLEAYRAICERLGEPMVQVSIAWLLAQPGVASVIAGATTEEQVVQNAGAGQLALDAETVTEISELF
ncbi:MAG: aldo/keto reductase [bacterium]|nr:aldo/keto reductase [bacterium]